MSQLHAQHDPEAAQDLYDAGARTHTLIVNNPLPPEGVVLDGALVETSRVPSGYKRGHTKVTVALGTEALGGFAVMNNAEPLLSSLFPGGAIMELETADEGAGATISIKGVDGRVTVKGSADNKIGVVDETFRTGGVTVGGQACSREGTAAFNKARDPNLLASAAEFVARALEHAQQR